MYTDTYLFILLASYAPRAKHLEIILSVVLWQHGENLSALN